jgi:small multidrug resistance pump
MGLITHETARTTLTVAIESPKQDRTSGCNQEWIPISMIYLALILGAMMAAAGQVMLKLGADGQSSLLGLVNPRVIVGLILYTFASITWLAALTRLPLHVVYPFTILTLVLVFAGSILFLGERPSLLIMAGWGVVCIGVAIVAFASS